ncbi:TetR family transcriptional regulator [Ktedonobacter sp. SOSP1-85]|uniref:TetR/AcrR family transcriptional regulator n=1 Tax=Ktedonobacter sp. SOSP1-85 TaxID=2778367 RepID=UPI00191682BC|nr:TetR/AcrR family transcriptional regulator [Ktedonobacter sp. SOSP1-85]GHO78590.1 TetR family transcriptional regulator [Ktedonobacter sp. SOSP1-85]
MEEPGKESKASARRRNKESHEAILQAALDLLERDGYKALTVEAIAALAGVGKQTIYRWWPSKGAVVFEAFAARAALDVPLPDLGTVREDVLAFIENTFRSLNEGMEKTVRSLMAEAQFDAEFGKEFRQTFIEARRKALKTLLERGIQRGELPLDTDLDFLLDMIYGPMWYRLLNQHAPLDAYFARQLMDFVLK